MPISQSVGPKRILENIYEWQGVDAGLFILNLRVDSFEGKGTQTAYVRVYLHATKKQMVTFTGPEMLIDQSFLVIDPNTWMYSERIEPLLTDLSLLSQREGKFKEECPPCKLIDVGNAKR